MGLGRGMGRCAPGNLTDRVQGVLHKVFVSGLFVVSLGALTYLTCGLGEIYMKASERKRLNEASKGQS